MKAETLPDFSDLPCVPGHSLRCSWGLFDEDGKRDEVGTLNLLTPEVVTAASKEVVHGVSISLNWSLENIRRPGFLRKVPEHKIIDNHKTGLCGHDDEIHINSQSGSQWDGFRHWGHQDLRLYYNGLQHEEISGPNPTNHNGLDHWHKRGCVAGRGVLIDYLSWAEKQGIKYHPWSKHCVSVKDLEEVAKEQNVVFKPGDILLVRTGMVKVYNDAAPEEKDRLSQESHHFSGVEGSEASVSWIWNNHFAAVAGDAIGFEAWPPNPAWKLHDWLLALLGVPIGELWDLEQLAEECSKRKKWTFFLTSSPLNVPGGVASPPNAIAIL